MPDDQVCCIGHEVYPADDGVWRCLRLQCSNLPRTVVLCCADTGRLSQQACTRPGLPHWASASRHIEAVSDNDRTCMCHWRGMRMLQNSASIVGCQSQTWVSQQVPCCNSPPGMWWNHEQLSLWTYRPVTVELVKAGEKHAAQMLERCLCTVGLPNYRRLPQTNISSPQTNFYLPQTNSNVWESYRRPHSTYRRPILRGWKATCKTANYRRLIISQTNSNVWKPGRWLTTADHLLLTAD